MTPGDPAVGEGVVGQRMDVVLAPQEPGDGQEREDGVARLQGVDQALMGLLPTGGFMDVQYCPNSGRRPRHEIAGRKESEVEHGDIQGPGRVGEVFHPDPAPDA